MESEPFFLGDCCLVDLGVNFQYNVLVFGERLSLLCYISFGILRNFKKIMNLS